MDTTSLYFPEKFEQHDSKQTSSIKKFIDGVVSRFSAKRNIKPKVSTARRFYISKNGSDRFDGLKKSTPFKSLDQLFAAGHELTTSDVVCFERNQIFEDCQQYKHLLESHVFVETFGHGDNPIVKVDGKYIEIFDSKWF